MKPAAQKLSLLFCLLVYLLAVCFSVYCLVIKRDALQYHTRDYPFYVEQAARLVDPGLSNRFALNIDGYNFLGLQGTESVKSIYHAIHTEYFRYTYTVLYFFFHSTLALYIFYCLIFFSPIPYFALIALRKARDAWQPVVLFALLYVLFPAGFNSVTYDLRPRIMFVAAWSLTVLAISQQRPFREKLVTFLFLFSVREESILLGAILLAFNFFYMRGQPMRWRQTLLLLGLDLATAAAFAAFMVWGGYTQTQDSYNPLHFLATLSPLAWVAAIAGLSGLAAATLWIWRARPAGRDRWLLLLTYGAALALTGLFTYRDTEQWYSVQSLIAPVSAWEVFLKLVTGAQNSLTFYILILLLVLVLEITPRPRRAALMGGLAALCIFFGALSVYIIPAQVADWNQTVVPARLVWDFKKTIDRYHSAVLVDYDTYQAFYDVENTFVYQRLPLWMVAPEDRFYPQNRAFLARLMRDRVDFAVISQGSLAAVQDLAALAGLPATTINSNEKYVVLKLR